MPWTGLPAELASSESADARVRAALDTARVRFVNGIPARIARIIDLLTRWRDQAVGKALEPGLLACELENFAGMANTLGFEAVSDAARGLRDRIRVWAAAGSAPPDLLDDPVLEALIKVGTEAPLAAAHPLHARARRTCQAQPARLLWVSADADLLASVAGMLGLAGFDVIGLREPSHILSVVHALKPLAGVLDLDAPTLKGSSLPAEVAGTPDLAWLGFSAGVDADREAALRAAGLVGIIDKRAPIDALITEVDRLIAAGADPATHASALELATRDAASPT